MGGTESETDTGYDDDRAPVLYIDVTSLLTEDLENLQIDCDNDGHQVLVLVRQIEIVEPHRGQAVEAELLVGIFDYDPASLGRIRTAIIRTLGEPDFPLLTDECRELFDALQSLLDALPPVADAKPAEDWVGQTAYATYLQVEAEVLARAAVRMAAQPAPVR
jgi:hypothetical protein